tara:strand:- start:9 stop:533 length:525 start_codon:yes stop_codon:yes gene_type:complete
MNQSKIWRYQKTVSFLSKHCQSHEKILDLGTFNELSKYIEQQGFNIKNTSGENLDINFDSVLAPDIDVVTAFEIFEHMLAPFNILTKIKASKLIASVPLRLWFSDAYWNDHDDWDKHYHEFEIKQFDFLLKQSGWQIIDSEKWIPKSQFKIGFRPLLRMFTPRYYIVYCERINS